MESSSSAAATTSQFIDPTIDNARRFLSHILLSGRGERVKSSARTRSVCVKSNLNDLPKHHQTLQFGLSLLASRKLVAF